MADGKSNEIWPLLNVLVELSYDGRRSKVAEISRRDRM